MLELDPDTSPWTTQWKKSLLAASRLTDPPGAPRPQWCQQEWRGQPTHPINCWVLMNCAALQKLLVFTTKMHYFILPPTSVFIFSLWLLLFWFHLASTFLGFFPLCPSSHLSLPFFSFFPLKSFFFPLIQCTKWIYDPFRQLTVALLLQFRGRRAIKRFTVTARVCCMEVRDPN